MGEGVGIVKALEAFHDRVHTEAHLYRLLSLARREPDRVKRATMYAQAAIDMAQFYLRGLKRGAMEPLSPELFESQVPADGGTGKDG